MAINPLPPDNTIRYFIDYTSMGIQHTVMFRFPQQLTDVATAFDDLTDAMALNMRLDDQITNVRFAAQGSDVTFPVATIGKNGVVGNTTIIADDPEAVFISAPFRGRPSGRKGRVDFYFPVTAVPLDANNRFPWFGVTQLGNLEAALLDLANTGPGGIRQCDISGAQISYNLYWNRAKSGYWQRRQRRG